MKEGKERLHVAAIRVGDAPTGRALKRVLFAADRVDDSAEIPKPVSVSASSTLPDEAALSSSVPSPSAETALSASATEVPDQVLRRGE